MNRSEIKQAIYEAFEAVKACNEIKELIKSELLKAVNEERWITVHPHGEDSEDYRRLKIEDGESVEDAMHRNGWYEKRKAKDEKALKDERKQLYQDILKAKKDGNKELHHKLLQRYKEVDAQLKGKKQPNQKEENSDKIKGIKEFKKATNIGDALKETNNYIIDIPPAITKMPLENLNEVNSGLHYIYNNVCKFSNLKEIKKSRMGALAAANGDKLVIGSMFGYDKAKCKEEYDEEVGNWQKDNEKGIETIEKNERLTTRQKIRIIQQYQENLRYKRFGVYSSPENLIKETIIHELGHTIEYQAARKDKEVPQMIRQALYKARQSGDIYKISKYSNKNHHEFFAECFLMYNIGEKQPDYIKDMIETIIKKL